MRTETVKLKYRILIFVELIIQVIGEIILAREWNQAAELIESILACIASIPIILILKVMYREDAALSRGKKELCLLAIWIIIIILAFILFGNILRFIGIE